MPCLLRTKTNQEPQSLGENRLFFLLLLHLRQQPPCCWSVVPQTRVYHSTYNSRDPVCYRYATVKGTAALILARLSIRDDPRGIPLRGSLSLAESVPSGSSRPFRSQVAPIPPPPSAWVTYFQSALGALPTQTGPPLHSHGFATNTALLPTQEQQLNFPLD